MTKNYALALAAFLLAAPMAFAHEPAGTIKNYCEDPSEWGTHDYVAGPMAVLMDGNVPGDCNGDTVPADYDNHMEHAVGGAALLVDSGDGVSGGTVLCYGEVGHHPAFGPISVVDAVFGETQEFLVYADTVVVASTTPACGDFQDDVSFTCTSPCTVPFGPGLDGAYRVRTCPWVDVNGDTAVGCTMGHVYSP